MKAFFTVPNELFEQADLTSTEKLIYIVLLRYAHNNAACFPSLQTIAMRANTNK